jgi:5-methylcytosine-specific restriction endonuclease McrA
MTNDRDAIALAERVLGILEEGGFSATYKFALFTAILDLCLEKKFAKGVAPESLSTAHLADRVIELYWDHVVPYTGERPLRQGGGANEQAEILSLIQKARVYWSQHGIETVHRARADKERFESLVCKVEWKLIEMPVPRLQVLGHDEDRFLYQYNWTRRTPRSLITSYQRKRILDSRAESLSTDSGFDNRLILLPGVADQLVRLNGILRPLFYRKWAAMVARMNQLKESELEEFLFGRKRMPLDPVREPLRELQDDRCFYCDERLSGAADVDHFIPWTRYPDNGLDNLVVAHPRCNNRKRDFLAAADHVEHWSERGKTQEAELSSLAQGTNWLRDANRTASIAKSIYSLLPLNAKLWRGSTTFAPNERERILAALAML